MSYEYEKLYIGELNKGFNLAGVYDLFGYRAQKFIPDINKTELIEGQLYLIGDLEVNSVTKPITMPVVKTK